MSLVSSLITNAMLCATYVRNAAYIVCSLLIGRPRAAIALELTRKQALVLTPVPVLQSGEGRTHDMDPKDIRKRIRRAATQIIFHEEQLQATFRDMPKQIHLTGRELRSLARALPFDDDKYWLGPEAFEEDHETPGLYLWRNPYYLHAEGDMK